MIYLDIGKAFDIVLYDSLINTKKIREYDLEEITVRGVHKWLKNCSQGVVIY